MLSLDIAQTWTRLLAVSAGAPAASGAPGPGTFGEPDPNLKKSTGPWLGLLDVRGFSRDELLAVQPWLLSRAAPLLLVRHLLLARPFDEELRLELLPGAFELLPPGFWQAPQPILILSPAGRADLARKREYVDTLLRLRVPLTSAGSDLWAIREYDPALLVAVAQLANAANRGAFRTALDPSQQRLFDSQLPLAEAKLLDDLVGARDDESISRLDVAGLRSLRPQAHPLAIFAAVERAHNRRRPTAEQTFHSGRTLEARLTGRGYPLVPRPFAPEFAAQAAALSCLPEELQRLSEAADLLDRV